METMKVNDSEVFYENISVDDCENEFLKEILENTKTPEAAVIYGFSGPNSLMVLQNFIEEHKDMVVFFMFDNSKDTSDTLTKLNKMSMQCNLMTCAGFRDISFWSRDDVQLMVCKNDQYIDFISRLEAWRAGSFMSSSMFESDVYLEIFADCFAGDKNEIVLKFMKQMNKALGKGWYNENIEKALEKADHIGKYAAVKSSVF